MKGLLSWLAVFLLSTAVVSAEKRTCIVPPSNPPGSDASSQILSTFKKCSKHATVVFEAGQTYTVGQPMNITGLFDVHISIEGTIQFTNNMTYWQENLILLNFQSAGTFWTIGGSHIRVDGGGTVDGQGQVWWDAVAKDPRPVLMTFDKVHDLQVANVTLIQSPFWHFFVRDTTNALFYDLSLRSLSNSSHAARNSDGWDLYRSNNVVIRNSVIANDDDCVSFKPNSTNMLIQDLDCTGSHGISVGSLGQYAPEGEIDVVKNILVKNVTCRDCQNGARVKTWPGGKGLVENITFQDMDVIQAENPIVITTHYCDSNELDYCTNANNQSLTIRYVTFDNIRGSVSDYGMPTVNVNCSSETPCQDIKLTNIDVQEATNTPQNVCVYVTNAAEIPYCPQYNSSSSSS